MAWAPLSANVQLDDVNSVQASPDATTAPIATSPASDTAAPQNSAPAASVGVPAHQSTASDPAQPKGFAPLPADAKLDDQDFTGPAQNVDTAEYDLELPGESPAQPKTKMSPDDEKTLVHILSTAPLDTAAEQARQFAASKGFQVGPATDSHYADSYDQVVDYRRHHGVVSSDVNYLYPHVAPTSTTGSTARGVADSLTAGGASQFYAGIQATGDTLSGNAPDGFINDYHRQEDSNAAIINQDEAQHPYARLTGQILGGLMIPSGLEGVGLEAGKSVLVAGGTMREARAAAAVAVRNRVAMEGAAYGGVHGAATADRNNQNIAVGAAEGAVEGAAGGYGLTAAGQAAAPIVSKVADAVVPAVQGVAETVRNATPDFLKSAPKTDYVQIARDLNLQRTPATNSKTGVAPVIMSGLGALPGGQPIASAAERESAGLAAAARNTAESVGPVSDRQGAGEAIAQGAQSYKQASKLQANELYGQRDAAMGGTDAPVSLDNFSKSVNDLAAQFPDSPALQQLREHPVIRKVTDALGQAADDGQVTLGQATEALSHVRGVLRNLQATNSASPVVISRVGKVEQGLEDDVINAAHAADQATGRVPGSEGSAVKAQQDADAFYADRAAALNGALKRPLKSAADDTQVSGESVYNQVSGDMDAKSGNLARLRETWFRLPPEAKNTFAATKIDDLGRATPGQQNAANNAWSYETFLTNLSKMSPQARNIVFGPEADKQLGQIATYASRLRDLGRLRNFSNTAQKYFAGAFMAALVPHLMHGDVGGALETASALPATWATSKILLATPAMRDWTAKALGATLSGGPNQEKALRALTGRLSSIAATQPAAANDILGLQQRLMTAFPTMPMKAAAANNSDNRQRR